MTVSQGGVDAGTRKAWQDAHVEPLWENTLAHSEAKSAAAPGLWRWSVMEPLIAGAIAIKSMDAIERRVLSLIDPALRGLGVSGTTRTLSAALQILMPGETARPHRHSMNALRFVLSGKGASTVVDGKDCPMAEGDLVLTPAWTWHEHVHRGSGPIVWLDVLDAALHRYLGTDAFEPGPVHDVPSHAADEEFAAAHFVPDTGNGAAAGYSPVFRYPWAEAKAALATAPRARDGARRVRYVNPRDGGPVMALIDCYAMALEPGGATLPVKSSASAVCAVVEGEGSTRIGDQEFSWGPRDVFSLPHGLAARHRAGPDGARLFLASDREVLRRLDLLHEDYGNERAH